MTHENWQAWRGFPAIGWLWSSRFLLLAGIAICSLLAAIFLTWAGRTTIDSSAAPIERFSPEWDDEYPELATEGGASLLPPWPAGLTAAQQKILTSAQRILIAEAVVSGRSLSAHRVHGSDILRVWEVDEREAAVSLGRAINDAISKPMSAVKWGDSARRLFVRFESDDGILDLEIVLNSSFLFIYTPEEMRYSLHDGSVLRILRNVAGVDSFGIEEMARPL